jgi:hypothetical protein
MAEIALLITALLFGGMVLYSFGFAAFVFNTLPVDTAGRLIRRAFPWFYVFVLVTAAVAGAFAVAGDPVSAAILAGIAVTTLFARQVLMPAINRATDAGEIRRFKVLHSASVLITLAHIGGAGTAIIRLSGV